MSEIGFADNLTHFEIIFSCTIRSTKTFANEPFVEGNEPLEFRAEERRKKFGEALTVEAAI